MAVSTGGDERVFARAIREALDSLVAPTVREALIHDALQLDGARDIPDDARMVRAFANGPLRTAAERALGMELAASVAEEILFTIQPWFDSALPPRRASAPPPPIIPRDPPRRSATPAPPTPRVTFPPATPRVSEPADATEAWPSGNNSYIRSSSRALADDPPNGMVAGASVSGSNRPPMDAPVVLLATEDDELFQTLAERFAGSARACRVRSPADLVRHLDGVRGQRSIVILDGKNPSIRPAALVVLLEDQPGVEVVLCRTAPAVEQVVLAASSATERWLVYREPASLEHVAAECLRLVS
jgi:hypothetical protein